MKKIIGYLFIGIFVLNIIGILYLIATNPDRLSNESGHFAYKMFGALVFGALGVILIRNSKNNSKSIKNEN